MSTLAEMDLSPEEGTLLSVALGHGLERPGDEALVIGDESLSWGDVRARVLHLAGAIDARIPEDGERVVLLADVSVNLVLTYLAIIAAGKVAVPLQVSAHPDALGGMIDDCEPGLLFYDEKYHDKIAGKIGGKIAGVRLDRDAGEMDAFAADAIPLDEPKVMPPEAHFNIIYSSGTTGKAKGIVHSHSMRWRQASRGLFGIDGSSTMMLATPLYSNTTIMPMLSALFHGGRVVMMPKFDAAGYLDLAEKYHGTHTMLVPVQYQRIFAVPDFGSRDLSGFKIKQSTGAPVPMELKKRIVNEWPGRFLDIYGLTEGGCTFILDAAKYPDKSHTVGKPADGNEIRLIDEVGNDVPVGERGEVIGRSRTMMSGYFRNKAANDAFYWRDNNGTLYHRTGDIGIFDADGFLTLVDRKKDVIISGGFNIYASDIEQKLLEHPEIDDACVIGIPIEKWGETPLGLVVAKPGTSPDPDKVLAWVNERLGRMQRSSAIELRDELPRNAAGKMQKNELKAPYWGKA